MLSISTRCYLSILLTFASHGDCTARFPSTDRSHTPFQENIPAFCFPKGLSLTTHPAAPTYFVFVATGGDGHRVYGATMCIVEKLTEVQREALRARLRRAEVEMTSLELLINPTKKSGGTTARKIRSRRNRSLHHP